MMTSAKTQQHVQVITTLLVIIWIYTIKTIQHVIIMVIKIVLQAGECESEILNSKKFLALANLWTSWYIILMKLADNYLRRRNHQVNLSASLLTRSRRPLYDGKNSSHRTLGMLRSKYLIRLEVPCHFTRLSLWNKHRLSCPSFCSINEH